MDALDLYLAQQSDVGQIDSEGSFTVSGERALEKLASHQLPRTSAWILKMMQAGIEAQASGIWVRYAGQGCRVAYADTDFGGLEEISRMLMDPNPALNPSQAHLVVGLRTVAFSRRRPILVAHHCPNHGVRTLWWDGYKMSPVDSVESVAVKVGMGWPKPGEIVFFISSSPLAPDTTGVRIKGLKNVVSAEFKELQKFAVCSPVPIWVDSRPLNHFGLESVSMTRRVEAYSVQAPAEGSSAALLRLPERFHSSENLYCGSNLVWILSQGNQPGPSKISWVNGGVVCEEETLLVPYHRFQVRLFVSVEDLPTDLTALHVRFQDKQQRHDRIALSVLGFCRELQSGAELKSSIAERRHSRDGVWTGSTIFMIGGMALAYSTFGLSVLAGIGASFGFAKRKKKIARTKQLPDLEFFLKSLQERYEGHI